MTGAAWAAAGLWSLLSLFPPEAASEAGHARPSLRLFTLARTGLMSFRTTIFNPDGLAVRALGWKRGPLSFLGATAEFEADGAGFHWRIDFQGSAGQAEDGRWSGEARFGQFYAQRDIGDHWILVAGRSIQRWGTGYVFNPTDVAAPEREIGDPENTERRAVGNDLVKLEYFGASSSLAFCLFGRLETRGGLRLTRPRLAFRYYRSVWDTDISLVALFSKEDTPVWGMNFSRVFGERLEVHGEAAVQKNSYARYHAAVIDGAAAVAGADPFSAFKSGDGRLYVQALLGFQWTFPGGVHWVVEYYHRGQGYSDGEWRRLLGHIEGLPETGAVEDVLWSLAAYGPRGTRRDYLMNYLQNLGDGAFQWRIGWLLGLSDGSGVLFPEIRWTPPGGFTFFLRSYMYLGGGESEFGALPRSRVLEGGLLFRK
ncbi:MAG: hypothetical protein JW843_08140 [Candidatus Aminicenantes bacterium]|nr:hypothetical protein [Candidatus Aminicenantes bacterium]